MVVRPQRGYTTAATSGSAPAARHCCSTSLMRAENVFRALRTMTCAPLLYTTITDPVDSCPHQSSSCAFSLDVSVSWRTQLS